MNIEESILSVFRSNPAKEFDTSELAREVFAGEFMSIERTSLDNDRKVLQEAKQRRFQLHRKILYYLNKLTEDHVLKIVRIKEKGEKVFCLAMDEGSLTLEKGYRKIVINKPIVSNTHIELYERKNIMKKYSEDSWITAMNAILLECGYVHSLTNLYALIKEFYPYVNDVIALNEFEKLFHAMESEQDFSIMHNFLERISRDCMDMDKTVSIIVHPAEAKQDVLKKFIEHFAIINPRRINIIFSVTGRDVRKYGELLSYVVEQFSAQKIKINIRNKEFGSCPVFKGRAGMYTFDDNAWALYEETVKGHIPAICCAQCSIAVNVSKASESSMTDTEFRRAIIAAGRALLAANAIQRRKSNEYFKQINTLTNPATDFYRFGRNYIRFWNYDWHKDVLRNDALIALLKSSQEITEEFCHSEETIFKSCGIPIRFKISFSSAFRNFDPAFMGEREYTKMNVHGVEEFYKGEIKEFVSAREQLFEVFDGGDRLRIFRAGNFKKEDILREFSTIMSSFKIPFFTYDFSGLTGMVKLTNFM